MVETPVGLRAELVRSSNLWHGRLWYVVIDLRERIGFASLSRCFRLQKGERSLWEDTSHSLRAWAAPPLPLLLQILTVDTIVSPEASTSTTLYRTQRYAHKTKD